MEMQETANDLGKHPVIVGEVRPEMDGGAFTANRAVGDSAVAGTNTLAGVRAETSP
jgi:hypothetical protein